MNWIAFLACAGAIVYSGSQLSRWGEVIAEETGWGLSWVGVALLASATSLPELITGVSAVTFAGEPGIAIGNAIGACAFNLFLLAALDAFHRIEPLSSKATQGNVLTAALGVILLAGVGAAIVMGDRIQPLGWIAPYSAIFVVVYLIGMRILFQYQKRQVVQLLEAVEAKVGRGLRRAFLHFGAHAAVVVCAALFLPGIAGELARQTGLGTTFVGSLIVPIVTSLPELVVSVTAIRHGAVDLAVGNLFGSNLFNVFILAVDDAFFTKGSLLATANPAHLLTVLSAMAMTATYIVGLTYRAEKRPLFLAWDSLIVAGIFLFNGLMLFVMRQG